MTVDNFKTIEVRWFYSGTLPDQVFDWFDTLGEPLAAADTRTDIYLQSSSPDLGIKLRQGNLEVKYRQAKLGSIAIDNHPVGQVEQWSKWICIDDLSGLTPERIADKPGWIEVSKIRYQRLYQVNFNENIRLISIPKPTANAAGIEVTQLKLADQIYWTIACEYFGDRLELPHQFLSLVQSLMSGFPISNSPPLISGGYPEWLNIQKSSVSVSTD